MSVLSELRRRNVFRVGVAYLAGVWLVLQVADVVLPNVGAPEWSIQVLILACALGFPAALILAWFYEWTSDGIRAASELESTEPVQLAGHRTDFVILALMLAILAFLMLDRFILAPGVTTLGANPNGRGPTSTAAAVQRFAIDVGPMNANFGGLDADLALSPDGSRLVYATRMRGVDLERLYLRPLEQFEVRPIPGTEESRMPFFSPDGERVAFVSPMGLATVSLRGGAPQTLVAEDLIDGDIDSGTWVTGDTIIFEKGGGGTGTSLFRVPVAGGSPELLLAGSDREGYIHPAALPGGEAILFTVRVRGQGRERTRDGSIAVLSLATNEFHTLIGTGYRPHYVPTGHIVFIRDGALWAVPFDVDRLQVTGAAVEVLGGVQHDSSFGGEAAAYAVSDSGLLVYVPGEDVAALAGPRAKSLVWVDQQGNEEPLLEEPRDYRNPRLSPDGQRLAVTILDEVDQNIWIYDLARGGRMQLTTEQGPDNRPDWTPDGERVVFRSNRDGGRVFWRAANGTGAVTRLSERGTHKAFTPDGEHLILDTFDSDEEGNQVLRVVPTTGDGTSESFVDYPLRSAGEIDLSPDGRWLAYTSKETGTEEIYVRPFPNLEGDRFQISTDGGFEPLWDSDEQTLFYRNADAMMSVSIVTEPEFSAGIPTELFRGDYAGVDPFETPTARPSYDVARDGRFLMLKYAEPVEHDPTQFLVVNNWFEELRRLAPPSD